MKYKCLVVDHDDTAVNSTASIHFPAHVEMMKQVRPNEPVIDLDTWFIKNSNPGIMQFLTEDVGLSEEEMELEYKIWQEFNENRNPPFYSGLPELFKEFIDNGGILAVASHSMKEHIRRHYEAGAPGVTPHFIFGWDDNPEFRKPSPWPIKRILESTSLSASDILVVDDLMPGIEMARAAGADSAGAGWGHNVPELRRQMQKNCRFWLKDVEALRSLVFGD